ncbi:MAG: hypothetical protein ACC654_05545 [Acidimicrobiia bacterium]
MLTLILATEELASAPPGDDLRTLSYALVGLVMLIAAIATLIVTPSAEDRH